MSLPLWAGGRGDGVSLAGVSDLSGLRAEGGVGGYDLGHVGGSSAVLGVVQGSDRGGGEASHGGGSDSSGETHFDIR